MVLLSVIFSSVWLSFAQDPAPAAVDPSVMGDPADTPLLCVETKGVNKGDPFEYLQKYLANHIHYQRSAQLPYFENAGACEALFIAAMLPDARADSARIDKYISDLRRVDRMSKSPLVATAIARLLMDLQNEWESAYKVDAFTQVGYKRDLVDAWTMTGFWIGSTIALHNARPSMQVAEYFGFVKKVAVTTGMTTLKTRVGTKWAANGLKKWDASDPRAGDDFRIPPAPAEFVKLAFPTSLASECKSEPQSGVFGFMKRWSNGGEDPHRSDCLAAAEEYGLQSELKADAAGLIGAAVVGAGILTADRFAWNGGKIFGLNWSGLSGFADAVSARLGAAGAAGRVLRFTVLAGMWATRIGIVGVTAYRTMYPAYRMIQNAVKGKHLEMPGPGHWHFGVADDLTNMRKQEVDRLNELLQTDPNQPQLVLERARDVVNGAITIAAFSQSDLLRAYTESDIALSQLKVDTSGAITSPEYVNGRRTIMKELQGKLLEKAKHELLKVNPLVAEYVTIYKINQHEGPEDAPDGVSELNDYVANFPPFMAQIAQQKIKPFLDKNETLKAFNVELDKRQEALLEEMRATTGRVGTNPVTDLDKNPDVMLLQVLALMRSVQVNVTDQTVQAKIDAKPDSIKRVIQDITNKSLMDQIMGHTMTLDNLGRDDFNDSPKNEIGSDA